LIRKKFDDIQKNHVDGPSGFRALLAPLEKTGQVKIIKTEIRFANGSCIAFQHCQDERQFDSAQGVEKHVLVIDEATQISERLIRFFRGWVRMSEDDKKRLLPVAERDRFPRIIYTANPIGASVGYFRRQFVKARTAFEIEPVEGFLRQYIPSKVTDNPSLSAEATAGRLEGLGDPAMALALLEGDWDAPLGEFFPMFRDQLGEVGSHVVRSFEPPKHWFKYITFDWGSAEPFAVAWWCVSDGVEFEDDLGIKRWFPRSSIIMYREWYGCSEINPAKGCEMRNADIARGIRGMTREDWSKIVITDSLPFQDRGMEKNGRKYKIADQFAEEGIPLILGNCARVTGWSMMRERLLGKEGHPMLFVQVQCKYARDYIPALPRSRTNPEDAASDGEATHMCDVIRLACTARPLVVDAKVAVTEASGPVTMTPRRILKLLKGGAIRGR
jgi:hypothetical protein